MAKNKLLPFPKKRKILIENFQSPGDILMLTAAVRDLKLSHPDIEIGIHTSCKEIWENNPYITELDKKDKDVEVIKAEYPLVHTSNEGQHHFIHGFRYFLEDKLNLRIKPTKFKGDIHISDQEKSWMSQVEEMGIKDKFWIIVAGGKYDFTCVAKGSRVQTKNGYKKIEQITSDDEILTEWGYKKCKGSIYRGKKTCTYLKTTLGGIWVTSDHRLKRINKHGNVEWVKVCDLQCGDYILGKRSDLDLINVKSNVVRDLAIDKFINLFNVEKKNNILKEYKENNWYFDQIIEMGERCKKDTYDILDSETESYIVEGLVSHNCKWYPSAYYQKIVDHFYGRITFVQTGETHHYHPQLKHVIDLVGKTDLRQFIRLVYHSVGVLCPVTLAMHVAAAIESKHGLLNRPCVVISGGREPVQWEAYPHHRFLATNGALLCCDNGGCWKSRCHKVGDGDKKDTNEELCLSPVRHKDNIDIPKCMDMIKPQDVIRAIEMYYKGGVLQYNKSPDSTVNVPGNTNMVEESGIKKIESMIVPKNNNIVSPGDDAFSKKRDRTEEGLDTGPITSIIQLNALKGDSH
jgi:ADP-heptose:LPS heptosyltransferase